MGLAARLKDFMGYPGDGYEDESPNSTQDVREVSASGRAPENIKTVLVKPERFEDARGIADHLSANRMIVLNLESAPQDVCCRLLDFLGGVTYAKDGQIKRVARNTFIITPYNVGILADQMEESGVFF